MKEWWKIGVRKLLTFFRASPNSSPKFKFDLLNLLSIDSWKMHLSFKKDPIWISSFSRNGSIDLLIFFVWYWSWTSVILVVLYLCVLVWINFHIRPRLIGWMYITSLFCSCLNKSPYPSTPYRMNVYYFKFVFSYE